MATVKKIMNLQQKVEILLTKYPKLRDDDRTLVKVMWDIEIKKMNLDPKTSPIDMFLSLYENGQLSDADLIKRARRKLQENKEDLRGKNWKPRHKEEVITRLTINKI